MKEPINFKNCLYVFNLQANLKKLMELVEQNNAGQVNQFLEKGLDPNFQDPKTGGEFQIILFLFNRLNKFILICLLIVFY